MLNLMMFEDILADLGCQSITVAATVEAALAHLAVKTFDIAMLDVNLGGAKSYPVADALAARGMLFFFSTGYGETGIETAYRDRPVLRKPFQPAEMAALLKDLLGSKPG